MKRLFLLGFIGMLANASCLHGGEIPAKYRDTVAKGLDWLAKEQHKDGYWPDNVSSVAMTAFAGMALLQEGSTDHSGKYQKNIRKAVEWLLTKSISKVKEREGLIGDPESPSELRYMFGHALSLAFLSQVCGEVSDMKLRGRIQDVVQRGVKFSAASQSSKGGWYYTSRIEGGDNVEGVATVIHLFGLREAREAGFPVPKATRDKGMECLKNGTGVNGGVTYFMYRGGSERPVITAAALDYLRDDRKNPMFATWLQYCQKNIPIKPDFTSNSELVHYFYARVIHRLGDDGYQKLFSKSKVEERVTWSRYRTVMFDHLQEIQNKDGSWTLRGWGPGPVFGASLFLSILQLDNQPLALTPR